MTELGQDLGFRFQPVLSLHQQLLICPSTELTKNKNEMRQGCTQTNGGALKGNRKAVFLSHTPSNCLTGSPWECPASVIFFYFSAFCLCRGAHGNLSSPTRDQPLPLHWQCRVSITGWPGKSQRPGCLVLTASWSGGYHYCLPMRKLRQECPPPSHPPASSLGH